jgi:hypothetical protein
VIQEMERLRRRGMNTTVQWTPSHKDIPGDEEADLLAKKAAGWDPNTGKAKPELRAMAYPIYTLRSAKKRTTKRNLRDEWTKRWQVHPHGRMYHPYAPTSHKAHPAAHSGRGKALSAVTIQMRTGKIGLYSYLHGVRPDRITTDRCRGCDRHRETLQHVLLD